MRPARSSLPRITQRLVNTCHFYTCMLPREYWATPNLPIFTLCWHRGWAASGMVIFGLKPMPKVFRCRRADDQKFCRAFIDRSSSEVQLRPKIYCSRAIPWTYEVTSAVDRRTWGATDSGYALMFQTRGFCIEVGRPTVASELTTCLCESQ
jgi:hypothetical protein